MAKEAERWKFKNLWKSQTEVEMIVEPQLDAIRDWIGVAARELSRKIMEAEEDLLIRNCDTKAPERLNALVNAELLRRKS